MPSQSTVACLALRNAERSALAAAAKEPAIFFGGVTASGFDGALPFLYPLFFVILVSNFFRTGTGSEFFFGSGFYFFFDFFGSGS